MIIVDAHQDIAYNQALYLRDYRVSALKHRQREQGLYPAATIGLPDAILGRVALVFSTLYVSPEKLKLGGSNIPDEEPSYKNEREAHDAAMRQLDAYYRLADEDERIRLVLSQSDLDDVLASWEGDERPASERLHGLVILMEGADPILEPNQFEEWYERGVRVVGTAWSQTRYSGGTGAPGGLTRLGRELLEQMAGYNALLDLSHMAEQAANESLDLYEGQLIASHTNPRKFCDTDRHFSDDMIRRLAERDGVMGVVMFNRFLNGEWRTGDQRLPVSAVYDIIDHICQLTGSAAHVGIGSDFDGGFGAQSIPAELETVTDLWLLKDGLKERGYSEADIEAILGGNMLRKLRQTLPG